MLAIVATPETQAGVGIAGPEVVVFGGNGVEGTALTTRLLGTMAAERRAEGVALEALEIRALLAQLVQAQLLLDKHSPEALEEMVALAEREGLEEIVVAQAIAVLFI